MAEHLKATFDWKIKVKVPGAYIQTTPRPTNAEIAGDAITVMNNATQRKWLDTMLQKGITDYQFLGINTSVSKVSEQYYQLRPDFWNSGMYADVTGTTVIEYNDQGWEELAGLAIASVILYLAANPIIIVAGLAFIVLIAGAVALSASIVNVTTGASSAVKTATSTLGGTVVTILAFVVIIVIAGVAIYLLVPNARSWMKERYNGMKSAMNGGNGRV